MMFNVIGYLENIQLFFQKLKDCLEPNALIFLIIGQKISKKKSSKNNKKDFLFKKFKITRISKGKIIKNKVKVDLNFKYNKKKQNKKF